ncbi:MAG: hypothetical protein HOP16_02220 [Acidobacteria bacterium]|nr:hypothetical protein [Acidobacteriota bacterium]
MPPRRRALVIVLGVALAAVGCTFNFFDQSQVPVVTVGTGLRPQISWAPSPAYTLSVYAGEKDGDGFGVIWYAVGSGGYFNRLHSPVTYGVPPSNSEVAAAPPLEAGKTYTVSILRKDEKGSGEGFTNSRHRYVGTHTFVARE